MASANNNIHLQHRLDQAKEETKQLYSHLERLAKKNNDADLFSMAQNIDRLNSKNIIEPSAFTRNYNNKNRFFSYDINLKKVRTLNGHTNKIADVKWSKDSKHILTVSQDGFMIIWDPTTGLKQNAVILNNQWVLAGAISPQNNLVASAGLNNNCTVYRLNEKDTIQQKIISIFKGHSCYISEIEFLNTSQIITASGDMTCCLWDIPKGKRIGEFAEHLGDVLSLSVDPSSSDPHVFASAGSDGYILLWDVRQPYASNSIQKFFASDSDISSLKYFVDSNSIASGSDDGVIRLFDLRADCKISEYSLKQQEQHNNNYIPKSFDYCNPDNYNREFKSSTISRFSNYSANSPIISDYESANTANFDTEGVISIDFSHSGRLMYSCYSEYGCVIWDLLKNEIVGKLEGHKNRITKVKTSPDGYGVCTGSWDNTVNLWTPDYD